MRTMRTNVAANARSLAMRERLHEKRTRTRREAETTGTASIATRMGFCHQTDMPYRMLCDAKKIQRS
jgi:hypothetical protein